MIISPFVSIQIKGEDDPSLNTTLTGQEEIVDTQKNVLYAQNGNLEMYINVEDNCNITIRDIKTNEEWTTTPKNYDEDESAEGNIKNEMSSQLLVDYVDDKNNKFSVSSRISSIKRGTYKIRKFKDGKGVQIDYDFSRESEQFIIPVKYQLSDKGLTTEVMFDKIEEYGITKITDITVLPYMLAGYQADNGYLLIPDGSGMIMDFSTGNKWAGTYEEMIYGRDYSKTLTKETSDKEIIHLPVYGAKIKNTAITAIIVQGDFNAYIGANPAGKYCRYANAYSKFIFRQCDLTVLADKDWNAREIVIVRNSHVEINPKIDYYFSSGIDADYNGMAKIYRNYLIDSKNYKKMINTNTLPSLYLEIFGLVKKQESFLGFMVNKKVISTDFKDIENILEKLNQNDKININVLLYGFDNGGYKDRYDKTISFDNSIGGINGFKKLQEKAKTLNSEIFVVYEPTIVYKNSIFMFRSNNTAKTMDRRYTPFNDFKFSTGEMINVGSYFLSPQKIVKYANNYIQSSLSKNINIAFESVGNKLYTDFNDSNFSDRAQIATTFSDLVKNANNNEMNSIAYGGNEYIVKGSPKVTDIPISSSGFDLESESIPFYQIVMHGLTEMSSKPINAIGNSTDDFLLCMQTGTQIKYRIMGKNNDKLRETPLKFLYNCYFDNLDAIKNQQLEFNDVHNNLQNLFIKSYARSGYVSKTIYENGTIIYINFNDKQELSDGFEIPGKSYKIIG